ncbi:MAG: tetratricopeptide repeat protein, partial [Vicinamibacteria bacterium]
MSVKSVAAAMRNAPCPCGSGKRYKNCHGAIVNDGTLGDADIAALVDEALDASALGRHVDATRLLHRVLAARPGDVVAEHNLALIRMDRGDPTGAIPALERTAAARPNDPGFQGNLGLAYARTDRFDDAIAAYRRALALDERLAGTWSNLGNTLRQLARYDEAEAAFARALEIDPAFTKAHWHLATSRLARNDVSAWEGYEHRWSVMQEYEVPSMPGVPRYRGEDPAGLTIVVEDEQGYGDALQSIRHVASLADRGARVVVRTRRPELAALLSTAPGVAEVVPFDATPPCDAWIPMMSLAGILRTPPLGDGRGPYLRADPSRAAAMRAQMAATPARLRVGLS